MAAAHPRRLTDEPLPDTREVLVSVQRVSKKYCSDLRRSMRYALRDSLRNLVGRRSRGATLRRGEFWALHGIHFDLHRGESLAVMGVNGAGKSTLLKLVLGTVRPTEGRITTRGRIGSLSDHGLGFDPVLTGRENAYMAAAVLGIERERITEGFDEIVSFAGLERFIDSPVQIYSAGMRSRLGFSVAMFLQPDVLLVDEVLAVGDVGFQHKCAKRARRYLERGGSLINVSHNPHQVQSMCDRCIIIDHGKMVFNGDVVEGVGLYHELVFAATNPADAVGGDAPAEILEEIRRLRKEPALLASALDEEREKPATAVPLAADATLPGETEGSPAGLAGGGGPSDTARGDAASAPLVPEAASAAAAANAGFDPSERSGVVIDEVEIRPLRAEVLRTGEPARISVRYRSRDEHRVIWGFHFLTADLATPIASDGIHDVLLPAGRGELACTLSRLPLLGGRYALRAAVLDAETRFPIALRGHHDAPHLFRVEMPPTKDNNMRAFTRDLVVLEGVSFDEPARLGEGALVGSDVLAG